MENNEYNKTIVDEDSITYHNKDTIGNENITFVSTNPDIQVNEFLETKILVDNNLSSEKQELINLISSYAKEINCNDFHGKGTIDDYKELFFAANRIVEETKHVKLDVDISGIKEFADTADELSSVFTSYITKLEQISIIDDTEFLKEVERSLYKIVNLSNVFAKFKSTIIATSAITIHKSTIEVSKSLHKVMDEVNCAMNYISNFVEKDISCTDSSFNLEEEDVKTMNKAVNVINNWCDMSKNGVSVAMVNNKDIQDIKTTSEILRNNSVKLKSLTNKLKNKIYSYKQNPTITININNSTNVNIQ